jgi:diguanylate cyclase (GGDEF)-like protein/PAS domain S-box-containing protein
VYATQELLQAILDGLPAMIGYWDRDLRNQMANSTYLEWFGLRPEQMRGMHIRDVLGPDLYEQNLPYMERALAGEEQLFDRTIVDVQGETRHTQASYIPDLRDGEVRGFFVLVTEITDRVRAQRRIEAADKTLHTIATAVARNASLEEVVDLVVERMHDVFAAETASVVRFDSPDSASILAIQPELSFVGDRVTFKEGEPSAAAEVLRTGQAATVEFQPGGDSPAAKAYAAGLRTGAAAPIQVSEELWGAVVLTAGEEATLGEDLLERLTSFAELVGIAIANAEAWRALEDRASTDHLTGLPNRGRFSEQLDRELSAIERRAAPLSLAIMDVDHFKRINDAHGHPVGDRALVELARRVEAVARRHELLARIGGDEFAWILPEADAQQAAAAAERLRREVEREPFREIGKLTVSIGVATHREGEDMESLRRRADAALYAAKERGRNNIATG